MMRARLIQAVLILLAGVGGLVAGDWLRPAPEPSEAETAEGAASGHEAAPVAIAEGKAAPSAYFRFPSQFFIPVMHGDRLQGMMVLTLTLEMPAERQEEVFRQEFRLRDALLGTLLIQANTGGFDGNYTIEPRMRRLREALVAAAVQASGGIVTDVLIEDIARQDSA